MSALIGGCVTNRKADQKLGPFFKTSFILNGCSGLLKTVLSRKTTLFTFSSCVTTLCVHGILSFALVLVLSFNVGSCHHGVAVLGLQVEVILHSCFYSLRVYTVTLIY
jgi:hypothetical protein